MPPRLIYTSHCNVSVYSSHTAASEANDETRPTNAGGETTGREDIMNARHDHHSTGHEALAVALNFVDSELTVEMGLHGLKIRTKTSKCPATSESSTATCSISTSR